MPDRVICDLYARVSTTEQAEEGFSLGEQEARLRAFAAAQGWKVNAFISDPGFSGAKLERPGIQAVMADAQAHRINKIVTYKLDRLSRSQKDTLHLIEDIFLPNKVDYVSMTESLDTSTPLGMAMIGILSVFAQLERSQIQERMALGRIARAKDGHWHGSGSAPFGYTYETKNGEHKGRLLVDDTKAAAVRRMFDFCLEGSSLMHIYNRLQAEFPGVVEESNPTVWVRRALTNPLYMGRMRSGSEIYEGNHEPIIDEAVFWAAQKKVEEYLTRPDRPTYVAGKHLLTGLSFCGVCGARCACINDKYVCVRRAKKKTDCPDASRLDADALDETVLQLVESMAWRDEPAEGPSVRDEMVVLEKQLKAIETKQTKLVDLYTLDAIPLAVLQQKSEALVSERAQLERRIEMLRLADTAAERERFDEMAALVPGLRSMPKTEQADVLRVLIKKITLTAGGEVCIDWNI